MVHDHDGVKDARPVLPDPYPVVVQDPTGKWVEVPGRPTALAKL